MTALPAVQSRHGTFGNSGAWSELQTQAAADDLLHDLGGAAENPYVMKESYHEIMKWQVISDFVLGSGVGCSPLSVGGSNISSNTVTVRKPGGPTWRT